MGDPAEIAAHRRALAGAARRPVPGGAPRPAPGEAAGLAPGEVWAVVPAKRLRQAKTRLAGVLDGEDRLRLCTRMLTRVVGGAVRAGLAGVVVVTGDWETARLADELGARVLREERPDLNAAVRQGLSWVARRAPAALVLPSDLPLVEAQDLLAVLEVAPGPPGAVLCPSPDGGTNALFLWPPTALRPAFGPHSAERHAAAAEASRVRLVFHTRPGLALDVDSTDDLAAYRCLAGEPLAGG